MTTNDELEVWRDQWRVVAATKLDLPVGRLMRDNPGAGGSIDGLSTTVFLARHLRRCYASWVACVAAFLACLGGWLLSPMPSSDRAGLVFLFFVLSGLGASAWFAKRSVAELRWLRGLRWQLQNYNSLTDDIVITSEPSTASADGVAAKRSIRARRHRRVGLG